MSLWGYPKAAVNFLPIKRTVSSVVVQINQGSTKVVVEKRPQKGMGTKNAGAKRKLNCEQRS